MSQHWRRLRTLIRNARDADLGINAYMQTLSTQDKAQAIADWETASAEEPAISLIVERVCPDCNISHDSYRVSTNRIAKFFDAKWWIYGPGIGGDREYVGDPIAEGKNPVPSRGFSRRWPRRLRAMLTQDNKREMRIFLGRFVRRKARQEAGA